MPETILLVAHSDGRDGRVAPLVESCGYAVEWRCPAAGDRLPGRDEPYAGAIVFGGPQSANDDLPCIRDELDWIDGFVAAGRPFLGICLGAQLLAKALGARVAGHPEGLYEIGYFPLEPTLAGGALFPGPMHVYHWHHEGFELPRGAELLAAGGGFPNQAFRYGERAFGLQFHPEVTPSMLRRWLKVAHEELRLPGAQDAPTQLAHSARFDPLLHDWTREFLARWLRGAP